ncbi:MAG TPA: hypothetical protein VI488_04140 [Candidatus Angelobacter sp.]
MGDQLPNLQPSLVESKLGLVLGKAEQAPNSLVFVPFNIMQKKNQPLGRRQLHHSALEMDTLHVATQAAGFSAESVAQGKTSKRRQMADFGQESRIDLFDAGKPRTSEGAQKSVCRQLIRSKFIIGDPKCQ